MQTTAARSPEIQKPHPGSSIEVGLRSRSQKIVGQDTRQRPVPPRANPEYLQKIYSKPSASSSFSSVLQPNISEQTLNWPIHHYQAPSYAYPRYEEPDLSIEEQPNSSDSSQDGYFSNGLEVPFSSGTISNTVATPTEERPKRPWGVQLEKKPTARRDLKEGSMTQQPSSTPIPSLASNNPWKNAIDADAALALALAQEEEHDLQMQRDRLLAYGIAHGTATDEDFELAYYMSRQSRLTRLPASATAAWMADGSQHSPRSNDVDVLSQMSFPTVHASTDGTRWGSLDSATMSLQMDYLEAREIEKEYGAVDMEASDSYAVAQRLQAEFDREHLEAEASWTAWKQTNVDECVVCGDEHHRDELTRPCQHAYCVGCLEEGFRNAVKSKQPFKCCGNNLRAADCMYLADDVVASYEDLLLELTTPNPIYCHAPRCAAFVPPRFVAGDIARCTKCRAQTCRHCRRAAHPGTFCAEDKETEAVKALGRKKGWKTCPGCNHLIERQSGCLHMICSRCQTAFCYRCSKRWKDCESTCPDRRLPFFGLVDGEW
jgi:IBR domain, a half RING-finger domain